jgi:DNA-binding transcriptional ArsR family regulator
MPPGNGTDPVRATLVAILQQLNRTESMHEGRSRDQSLELADLERILRRFAPVDDGQAKVSQALGLLVRNGMVHAQAAEHGGRGAHAPVAARYRITAEGKAFLIEALRKTDRIA